MEIKSILRKMSLLLRSFFIIAAFIFSIWTQGQPADSLLLDSFTKSDSLVNELKVENITAPSFNGILIRTDSISKLNPNTQTRTLAMSGIHVGLYTGTLVLLNEAWYKDYPRSSFHTINDWPEWLQVDKVGHTWSAYQLSRMSYAGWRWTGLPEKKAVWAAGISGFTFQTAVEILDGYSKEWGWSWSDFGANLVGAGLFVGQHLGWQEERISFKFSFHKMVYDDSVQNMVSDDRFGTSLAERMIKDYNGQTYWLSVNLKSFMKQSKLPPWLNVALGYGANGMFGSKYNSWVDPVTGEIVDLNYVPRQRQWYLAPDIDFTKIKTNKKWVRSLFYALNAFKFPAPTLMLSKGKLTVHGFYF